MNNNEHNARFFVLLGLAVALCILCTPVAAAGRPIIPDLTSTVPVADFSASPTSGTAPLPVQFTDLSTGDGISAWAWDFNNDSVIESTEQNPSYIYTTAGNYTVNLTVTGTDGNDEVTKTDYITVTEPVPAPVAEFTGTPVSGDAPLTVDFTDASTGAVLTYAWDFDNDGVVDSTEQNPQHIYDTAGTYTVNLTVVGPGGSNESIKTDYITVTEPVPAPVPEFIGTPVSGDVPLTVDFTDASSGAISTYAWDFENDGIIDSTEQNPQHVYNTVGTYTVNLTVVGSGGSNESIKTDYITVTEPVPAPVAEFTGTPVSGDAPLTVDFTDASSGAVLTYAWDFDNDGVIDSTEQNPQHVYDTAGTYTVNLTVVGPGGSDESIKTDYITVTEPVPGRVSAEIRIEPQTLNLKSSGVFTVFITLPDEYSVTGINPDSLVCEGAHAKSVKAVNGTKNEYMAKFDRKDLVNVAPGKSVIFTITGTLNTDTGILEFDGNETVRVIK